MRERSVKCLVHALCLWLRKKKTTENEGEEGRVHHGLEESDAIGGIVPPRWPPERYVVRIPDLAGVSQDFLILGREGLHGAHRSDRLGGVILRAPQHVLIRLAEITQ